MVRFDGTKTNCPLNTAGCPLLNWKQCRQCCGFTRYDAVYFGRDGVLNMEAAFLKTEVQYACLWNNTAELTIPNSSNSSPRDKQDYRTLAK